MTSTNDVQPIGKAKTIFLKKCPLVEISTSRVLKRKLFLNTKQYKHFKAFVKMKYTKDVKLN